MSNEATEIEIIRDLEQALADLEQLTQIQIETIQNLEKECYDELI